MKTISADIKERITTMGNLFVSEGMVKPYVVATDSALLKSRGKVWHASSMKEGIVPCPGIDTDARWGYSHTKEWIFDLDTNCIWYAVLIFLLQQYPFQPTLQKPTYLTNLFIRM